MRGRAPLDPLPPSSSERGSRPAGGGRCPQRVDEALRAVRVTAVHPADRAAAAAGRHHRAAGLKTKTQTDQARAAAAAAAPAHEAAHEAVAALQVAQEAAAARGAPAARAAAAAL